MTILVNARIGYPAAACGNMRTGRRFGESSCLWSWCAPGLPQASGGTGVRVDRFRLAPPFCKKLGQNWVLRERECLPIDTKSATRWPQHVLRPSWCARQNPGASWWFSADSASWSGRRLALKLFGIWKSKDQCWLIIKRSHAYGNKT